MVEKRFKKVGNYLDYTSTGMQRVLDNLDRIENKKRNYRCRTQNCSVAIAWAT